MPMSRSAPRGAAVIWRPVRGRYCRATWMVPAAPPPALLYRLPVSQGLLVIGDGQRHPSHLHVRQHALGGHLQVLADGLRPPAPQLLQSRGGHHEACAVDHGGQPQSGFPLVVKAVHHPVVDGVASRDGAVIWDFCCPDSSGAARAPPDRHVSSPLGSTGPPHWSASKTRRRHSAARESCSSAKRSTSPFDRTGTVHSSTSAPNCRAASAVLSVQLLGIT